MKKPIVCLCLSLLFCAAAVAQSTETVLYSFAGRPDGVSPSGGLLFDSAGNIYGTTVSGGTHSCTYNVGCGTVYELTPSANGYIETILYNFCGTNNSSTCNDGANPSGGLIWDRFGNLYGATFGGGIGDGIVFELSPPVSQGNSWTETTLWEFGIRKNDGIHPYQGRLNWDTAGNLYGTTWDGGSHGDGTVFELSPNGSGGWNEKVLLNFSGANGEAPVYGVAIDAAGNLYGTAPYGGPVTASCSSGCGTVFELSPAANGWIRRLIYGPTGMNGSNPFSTLSIDSEGNLYGTLAYGGESGCYADRGCGVLFRLAPNSEGEFKKYSVLLNAQTGNPMAGVAVGADGGLIGTSYWGNNVYEIKNGTAATLYQFCSQPACADGTDPSAGIPVLHNGIIYGNTLGGGEFGNGVVYSVSP